MRTATSVIIGAVLAWCWIAIWRGPSKWFFYRIPPRTPTDHVDRICIWIGSVEQEGASWPTTK